MHISIFDDLLRAARLQAEPQRLLLVFAGATLGPEATPDERAAFEAGHGGELQPLMCVDKDATELPDFAALAAEAQSLNQSWVLVFAAALSGRSDTAAVDTALKRMVEQVRGGQIDGFIPFNQQGQAVRLV